MWPYRNYDLVINFEVFKKQLQHVANNCFK